MLASQGIVDLHGVRCEFDTTCWSLVASAGAGEDESKREALESLCRTYWHPLYAFVRRKGHGSEQAKDLVQGFFASLLSSGGIAAADSKRGKFRTFLLSSLSNYLMNDHRKNSALKRGGGVPTIPLELEGAEGSFSLDLEDPTTPETLFEKRWAEQVINRSLDHVREETSETPDGAERFELLKPFLMGDHSRRYEDVAEKLGTSAGGVKSAVFRMRRRFREALYTEVSRTVSSADEVEEELRYLFAVLCR